jgi:hypothetical protein
MNIQHHNLHLLALERKGWRRWIFGRWVYSSEPFRRDIQRQCAGMQMLMRKWETLGPEWDAERQEEK